MVLTQSGGPGSPPHPGPPPTTAEVIARLRAGAEQGRAGRAPYDGPELADLEADEPYTPDPTQIRYGQEPCRCGRGQTMRIGGTWWCTNRVRHVTGPVPQMVVTEYGQRVEAGPCPLHPETGDVTPCPVCAYDEISDRWSEWTGDDREDGTDA